MPFEVLEGFPKGCGGDVLAMEWCPTMDLIALITSDSQILVHRVTWQRLFVISVDEQPVRCLAWRPDGKQLAAGHADGSVTLYDVEDGEQLSRHREHPSPLCLFSWVEAAPAGESAARESPYVGSLAGLFAPLPQLPKQATAQQLLMDEGAPQLDAPLRHLLFEAHQTLGFDVAVTADTNTRVHLAVHGRFSLGTLHLAELPALQFGRGAPPTLVAVQLASTLHALTVVLRTSAATEVMLPDGTRQAHEAGTLLLSFRTGQLGRSRQEISALALVHMQCEALVQRAYAAMGTAERVWREAAEGLHAKLAKLGDVLREDGRASTPAVELAMLLASGVPPSCVQAFLLREFSAEALTRTHKAITVAAAALTQLCVCHLAPASEVLMQRLGHLHGLSRWPFHFAALGLQPQRVHAALEAAVSLRAAVEALLVSVQQAQAELGMLISWLVRTNRRLRDEPPPTTDELPPPNSTALCAMLKRAAQTADGLPRDPVLELFSEDEAGPPLATGAADELDAFAQLPPPLRLPAAQKQLDAALEECFRSVAQHVSAGLQLHSCTALAAGAGTDAPLLEMQHQPPPRTPAPTPAPPTAAAVAVATGEGEPPASPLLLLSLVLRDGAEAAGGGGGGGAQLLLLRARWGLQDADAPAWEACAVRCAPRQQLLSCHFYKDEQLALVLAGEAAGSIQLTIMPRSQLMYVPLGGGPGGGSTPLLARVAEMLATGLLAAQPMGEEARHRCFAAMEDAQLALSQQRGMACLVAHMRRVLLLDLEEDEEGDDDDDEGDDVEEDGDEDMTMDDD